MIEISKLEEIRDGIKASLIHIEGNRLPAAGFVLGQCFADLETIIGEDEDARDQAS